MDPCPFVRVTVGNLALKILVASKPARSVVHPSFSPCFCKIKLNNLNLPPRLQARSLHRDGFQGSGWGSRRRMGFQMREMWP
ncbi:hypothetical protein ACFX13_001460 [Malus domestica]